MWSAYGMLGTNPKLAEKFRQMINDPNAGTHTKKLLFTILTRHNHPEAQAAVRKLLADKNFKADDGFVAMLQEAGFIPKPEKATTDLIQKMIKEGEGIEKHAAAYTMGTSVRNMYNNGDRELALEYNQTIVEELEESEDPVEQQRYISGIGV